jgi:hypothetical protein
MKVFVSWSGELSRHLASAIDTWLPKVLQLVTTYFTPEDIEKGARWGSDISKNLEESQIGLFCMTKDNLNSSWIMFEAGAISKKVKNSYVCPILFKLDNSDIKGPLSLFQMTKFNKDEMKKLIITINSQCEKQLSESTLEGVFEKWWPDLEKEISSIIEKHGSKSVDKVRDQRDMVEEILSNSRQIINQLQEQEQSYLFRKISTESLLSQDRLDNYSKYFRNSLFHSQPPAGLTPFELDLFLKNIDDIKKRAANSENTEVDSDFPNIKPKFD